MNVSHILATKGSAVATIGAKQPVKEAICLLNQKKIGSLVVLDDAGKVAGMLSERDIVRHADQWDDVLQPEVHDLMAEQK